MTKKFSTRSATKILRETLSKMGISDEDVGIGWRNDKGDSRNVVILPKDEARSKTGSNCLMYICIEDSSLYSALNFYGSEKTPDGEYVVDILCHKFGEYGLHYEMVNTCELTVW